MAELEKQILEIVPYERWEEIQTKWKKENRELDKRICLRGNIISRNYALCANFLLNNGLQCQFEFPNFDDFTNQIVVEIRCLPEKYWVRMSDYGFSANEDNDDFVEAFKEFKQKVSHFECDDYTGELFLDDVPVGVIAEAERIKKTMT